MTKTKIKKKHISHSQYIMWSNCPQQWKMTYIDKLAKGEDSIHSVFGSAMHDTVQFWLDVVYNRSMLMARTMDLSDYLKERMVAHFKRTTIEADGQKTFVCDKETLMEFYHDGVEILGWLQKNVERFFGTLEWRLEGVEIALNVPVRTNVKFRGYLDIVLRHKLTGAIKIIDLKTSTKGWGKWTKEDKPKTDQLLLYKEYYAKKYDLALDAISIDYYILRRKIPTVSDWPIPRVSQFAPAHGTPSMNKMRKRVDAFLDSCFDEEGRYLTEGYEVTPSKSSCRFCSYNQTKHCSDGVLVT